MGTKLSSVYSPVVEALSFPLSFRYRTFRMNAENEIIEETNNYYTAHRCFFVHRAIKHRTVENNDHVCFIVIFPPKLNMEIFTL